MGDCLDEESFDFETVVEVAIKPAWKKQLLHDLSISAPSGTLVQSLALSVAPTEAASWIDGPEMVAGFSILPPIEPEGIIELASAVNTSEETFHVH